MVDIENTADITMNDQVVEDLSHGTTTCHEVMIQ
ncbi:hypothetical protein BAMA111019_14030 [Bacillus manliponensis]